MHRYKLVALLVALGALAAIVGVSPAAAAPSPTSTSVQGTVHAAPSVPDASLATLFDNNNNDSGVGITSQNFEPAFDAYDSEAADDFTVPGGHVWKVKQVTVTGTYDGSPGPANSENVRFYTNAGSLPDELKNEFDGVVGADSGGSFTITLPTAATLPGGSPGGGGKTYWVSVQANMDLNTGGQWFWENSTNSIGNDAAWRNPGDGFGTGCTSFARELDCIPAGEGPSHMFALAGTDLLS
jgi:hypothetical protein